MEKIVALEQACSEAVECLFLEEVCQQFFGDLCILGFGCVLHCILEEVVLLAQLDTLLPSVVTFIQIGSNPPELDEVMLLELQGETDVVKVVEGIDGSLETVVV